MAPQPLYQRGRSSIGHYRPSPLDPTPGPGNPQLGAMQPSLADLLASAIGNPQLGAMLGGGGASGNSQLDAMGGALSPPIGNPQLGAWQVDQGSGNPQLSAWDQAPPVSGNPQLSAMNPPVPTGSPEMQAWGGGATATGSPEMQAWGGGVPLPPPRPGGGGSAPLPPSRPKDYPLPPRRPQIQGQAQASAPSSAFTTVTAPNSDPTARFRPQITALDLSNLFGRR
jgi:hypothetical protein